MSMALGSPASQKLPAGHGAHADSSAFPTTAEKDPTGQGDPAADPAGQ